MRLRSLLWGFTIALGITLGLANASGATAEPEWVTPPADAPRVSFQTFESEAAGTQVSFHIYTPAAYAVDENRRLPVVYWLHGTGGGMNGIAPLSRLFDAAIERASMPPVLVVFVNGMKQGMYVDWMGADVPLEQVIIEELIPHVDANWRTVASRKGRLIDGFSMGGYGAARLGFRYPELFGAVSMIAAGPLQETLTRTPRAGRRQAQDLLRDVYGNEQSNFQAVSPRRHAAENARLIADATRLRVVIGREDETYENNRAFHAYLTGLGIDHDWIVLPGIGHNPLAVLNALGERNWAFYRAAFAQADDGQP
jgi:enterochelin esterase-like enzyme